ncbi:MAG: tetratricopeptide repeat protein [Streptosporangiaceae bacterium]|nr:tetratricopeptide repeat protein [Streptosporangiaceae bacterium]
MKVGGSPVVDAFSQEVWERFRGGLLAVRDVMRARDHSMPDEERKALRAVAGHPAFGGLGLTGDGLARGKWIVQRTATALDVLRGQLPPAAATAAGSPADKAVLLWAAALSEGLYPDQLARRFPDLLPGRSDSTTKAAATLRVRGVMWLPGNRPLRASEPGVTAVYYGVTAALLEPGASAPALAEAGFDYEWRRLMRDQDRAPRQLVTLLSFLAPAPLPLSLLRDGWEALPSPLRRTVRHEAEMARLAGSLVHRALAAADPEAVTCSQGTQEQVRRRLSDTAERSAASFAVRFMRAALPANTHHYEAWDAWRPALPHLDAALGHAQRLGVRLEDAAHLLDRLAVYYREAENDAQAAIKAGELAITLTDRAGRPDLQEYAIYLGNYAMALRFAHRLGDAVDAMDRSLQVTRDSLGAEHEDYAGSLGIKGNILGSWKRYAEADAAHREALAIIRRVMARRPEPEVRQTMVEILNDYGAYLLGDAPGLPGDAPSQAVSLLDEALAQVGPGDYGWRQITMNRAHALRRLGQLGAAEEVFRGLVTYCEEVYGDPSYELSVALRDLADVLQETGNPEYHDVYLRSHEVDDLVGPNSPADPDDPMS